MALASILHSIRGIGGFTSPAPTDSTMMSRNGNDDVEEDEDCAVLSFIEEDDYWLDKIRIGSASSCTEDGQMEMNLPRNHSSLSRLGNAIGRSGHIRTLCFDCSDDLQVDDESRALFEGIKRNMSIRKPAIWGCDRHISDGAGYELLEAFGNNATNFTRFEIWRCGLEGAGTTAVASFLQKCRNLEKIKITSCQIDSVQLGGLVSPVMAHRHLYELNLDCNDIGSTGCEAIAAMLQDPSNKLRTLRLRNNGIDDSGAITLAHSLTKNDKLQELDLQENSGITSDGWNAFSQLLCNPSSANATYLSNHTLRYVGVNGKEFPKLASYLQMNEGKDKSLVRTNKILQNETYLDMKPFFEWDLKMLPLVMGWINNATLFTEDSEAINHSSRKLFAIYQFIQANPPQNGWAVDLSSENNEEECIALQKSKISPVVPAVASCMLLGLIKTAGLV